MKIKTENLDDVFEIEECTDLVVLEEEETTDVQSVVGFNDFLNDFNIIKSSLISDVTSYDTKITQLLQEDDVENAALLISAKQNAAKAVLSGYDDLVRLSLALNKEQQASLSDILKD